MDKPAIDILIQGLVWTYVFISYTFHKYLEVELLGHMVSVWYCQVFLFVHSLMFFKPF